MSKFLGSNLPTHGKVRDISVNYFSYDSAVISYSLEGANLDELEAAVFLNGTLSQRIPSNENIAELSGFANAQNLQIIGTPVGKAARDYHGLGVGQRIYLDWDNSTSSDCAGYIIYKDDIEVARVTNIAAEQREFAVAGTGRYSCFGQYFESVNKSVEITFNENTFEADGVEYDFAVGSPISVGYGIKIIFFDEITAYEDFSIWVGPETQWTSNLPEIPGTFSYSVKAFDASENLSITLLERNIFVPAIPQNPTVEIAGEDISITFDSDDIDEVRVYSDYLPAISAWSNHIDEKCPNHILEESATVNLPVGTRFYVRSFKNGIENPSIDMMQILSSDPEYVEKVFSEVSDLLLIPKANGKVQLSFTYKLLPNDSTTRIQIFIENLTQSESSTSYLPLSNFQFSGEYFVINWLSDSFEHEDEVKFTLRASDSESNTGLGVSRQIVIDAVAPKMTGKLYGIST